MSENVFNEKMPVYNLFAYNTKGNNKTKAPAYILSRPGCREDKKEFIADMQGRIKKIQKELSELKADVNNGHADEDTVNKIKFLEGKIKDIRGSIQSTKESIRISCGR